MTPDILTIHPLAVDPVRYHQAVTLRQIASETTDPAAWARAAHAFTGLDMQAAAEACRERAEYYEVTK